MSSLVWGFLWFSWHSLLVFSLILLRFAFDSIRISILFSRVVRIYISPHCAKVRKFFFSIFFFIIIFSLSFSPPEWWIFVYGYLALQLLLLVALPINAFSLWMCISMYIWCLFVHFPFRLFHVLIFFSNENMNLLEFALMLCTHIQQHSNTEQTYKQLSWREKYSVYFTYTQLFFLLFCIFVCALITTTTKNSWKKPEQMENNFFSSSPHINLYYVNVYLYILLKSIYISIYTKINRSSVSFEMCNTFLSNFFPLSYVFSTLHFYLVRCCYLFHSLFLLIPSFVRFPSMQLGR